MAKVTEFCVALDNRPGTLGRLGGALRRSGVNVDAVSVSENSECCWVRLIPSPASKARRALTRARYHFSTRAVLAVRAHNRPGALASVATKLGQAGVNIQYLYGSNAPREESGSILVICVDDLRKAAAALRQA